MSFSTFRQVTPRYGNAGVGLLPSPEIINTEVQIIKSPQLAERLVKDVPFPDEDGNIPPTISDEAAKHQARWMKSLIVATPDKKSTVIDISITSSIPAGLDGKGR